MSNNSNRNDSSYRSYRYLDSNDTKYHIAYLEIETIDRNTINGNKHTQELFEYSDGTLKNVVKQTKFDNYNINNFKIVNGNIFINKCHTWIKCHQERNEISLCSYFPSIITFIIGCVCYFSGWSNIVGGIQMTKEIFEVTNLCEYDENDFGEQINHIVYGYFNISNSNKMNKCELETGYELSTHKECVHKFGNKYHIGSLHNIYYDHGASNDLNRCVTVSEANTLAIVGFSFLILSAILFLFAYFVWYPKWIKNIKEKNELWQTNFDVLKNKLLVLSQQNNIKNNKLLQNDTLKNIDLTDIELTEKNNANNNANNFQLNNNDIKIKLLTVKCLICLDKTQNCDEYIILKCNHIFHEQCLTELCNGNDVTCPICNKQLDVYCDNI